MSSEIGRPTSSYGEYPKIRSEAAFALMTTPSSVLQIMASSDESKMLSICHGRCPGA